MSYKQEKTFLIISIILLVCLVVGASYALFSINDEQEGKNKISSGCVSVSFSNETGTLSIDKAYPMTDIEGQSQTGYSFKLKNNCDSEVAYVVNLDVFNVSGVTNLEQDDIILGIDSKVARDLTNYNNTDKHSADASYAKNIYSNVLKAREEYTHTIKLWVDENVGNEAQNAKFKSQIFVIAGQDIIANGVTPEECFIVNETGEAIVRYKSYYCPDDVVVPRYINGVEITEIYAEAFNDANMLSVYNWDTDVKDYVILDEENYDFILKFWSQNIYPDAEWASEINFYKASEYSSWENFNMSSVGTIDALSLHLPLHMPESEWQRDRMPDEYSYTYLYGKENYPEAIKSLDLSRLKNLKIIDRITMANKGLKTIELPEGVEEIIAGSFNTSINAIFLPTTLKKIGDNAFSYHKITNLEFNSEITIGRNAFVGNNINALTINKTLTIDPTSFSKNPNLLAENIKIGYHSKNTAEEILNSAALTSE